MKLIRPITITPAMVTANNAVDADPAWAVDDTYAADARVTHERRIYKSLQADNTGHPPGDTDSVAWWSDQGSANSWAMFDAEVGTRSTRAESLSITVSGVAADTVGLLDAQGQEVVCTVEFDGQVVCSKTVSLWDTSIIGDWAEYFFNQPEYKTELVLDGYPKVPGLTITLTINAPGGVAGLGMVVMGRELAIGDELVGLARDGIDYSNVEFDSFGALSLGKRSYVRKLTTQVLLNNRDLDRILRRLDALASVPLLIVAGAGLYGSMVVYGLLTYKHTLPLSKYSYIDFEVKGLI